MGTVSATTARSDQVAAGRVGPASSASRAGAVWGASVGTSVGFASRASGDVVASISPVVALVASTDTLADALASLAGAASLGARAAGQAPVLHYADNARLLYDSAAPLA